MRPVEYGDLSEDVQRSIAELEVKVHDLEFEANFYRWATLIVFVLAAERLWDRLFS